MNSSLSIQRRGRKRRASDSDPDSYILLSSANTKRLRSRGVYDPNFEQRMIDNAIYPAGYKHPDGRRPSKPLNWAEIQQVLIERRSSLSSYLEYDEFVEADYGVTSENRATVKVIPMIQGRVRDDRCVNGDIPLNNLADIMRGPSHKAKPDVYYGARPEQLRREVRDKLQAFVVPSTKDTRPLAPNFFIEAKSPSGPALVNINQACFAGAAGARGIHSLQTYGQQTQKYDNNAYTLSTTYHSGTLKIYSHHISQPHGPGTQPEYYMHQLYAWALTASKETLIQGITAFRNAESWTEAQRNTAIDHANAVANGDGVGDTTAASPPLVGSLASQMPFPQRLTRWWNGFFSEAPPLP
ncbi:MAG: hypothetical protein M1820_001589 [Bogoriella megaspora]|nr:MAG: hypothetical protein M1820_001589 [Bogoriella megaspora]